MTLPKLLGFLKVRSTKDKPLDSNHIIGDSSPLKVEELNDEQGHTREDGCLTSLSSPPSDLGLESALKNLDEFIGANVRTISRASTNRSGGLTARSVNSACNSRPLSKVLGEIEALPCEMDGDLHTSVHVSVHASKHEGDLQRQPWILKTTLSDIEKLIDANTRTISDTSCMRSGNLTAMSINSACSSRPITLFDQQAYREIQKLGENRTAPEQQDTPAVIAMGDGPVNQQRSIPLGDFAVGMHTHAPAGETAIDGDASAAAATEMAAAAERDTFALLEELQTQLLAIANRTDVIRESLEEEAVSVGKARDSFAQLEARLSKLQCKGIDCVSIAGLSPERAEEARALRKDLTMKAERLQSRLDDMFKRIAHLFPN